MPQRIFFFCILCVTLLAHAATAGASPQAGQTWTDPATGMEFVWIPEGCFMMGTPEGTEEFFQNEAPRHEVCVDGFWMARYEVSNAQYRMKDPGHDSKGYENLSLNGGRHPVVGITWDRAKAFTDWMSGKGNGRFRLATEAEWEYAARAGTDTSRFWGDAPDAACPFANVADRASKRRFPKWEFHDCEDGFAGTAPVGSFKPNAFGLYDMIGNAWEWCEDVYDAEAYAKHAPRNPLMTGSGTMRIQRGGGWSSYRRFVRVGYRRAKEQDFSNKNTGLRVVRIP